MPPKKKLNASASSSKKPNQNQSSQTCKFGIQHFFERHSHAASQNSEKGTASASNAVASASQAAKPTAGHTTRASDADAGALPATVANLNPFTSSNVDSTGQVPKHIVSVRECGAENGVAGSRKVENGMKEVVEVAEIVVVDSSAKNPNHGVNLRVADSNKPSQTTPPDNLLNSLDVEISPEVSKNVSRKRFKFSPGMLIQQSQDDGVDEITWKISPINERLQSISKHAPDVVKALADASRFISSNLQQCSNNKILTDSQDRHANLLSSPSFRVLGRNSVLSNRESLKKISSDRDTSTHRQEGSAKDVRQLGICNSQSPFPTPPSLAYCNRKSNNSAVHNDGVPESMGLRQHKKALLELLDQVKDAISDEESTLSRLKLCPSALNDGSSDEKPIGTHSVVRKSHTDLQADAELTSLNPRFLVLEVTEKRGSASSSGAQCSFKVLRLLNEKSGKEQSLRLWDDWFYSIIEPGDTMHVIGEFDNQGNCNVNRDENFIIVHPNILVSGTRVAGSFSCSRRAVLDERLKCSEQSTAALVGSLLHQIFQAGLLLEVPTEDLLYEYSRIVLNKNVENLYACGVNENEVYVTLAGAIPRIINWIKLFKHSQNSNIPVVDFGLGHGLKQVSISEVVDIEEMAWAPKYGLKGMIDASVRVRIQYDGEQANEKVMPLEFKTGKAGQSAMEHTAQVILYTLLMSERYLENIDSGLLYYLQTDHTQGTLVQRSDVVGLLMRRNELARDITRASMVQQLPPMLRSPNMCKSCRHLNVCTIYHKAHGGNADSSGLGDIFDSLTSHLTNSHIMFLKQWDRLIDLEAKEVTKNNLWQSHVSKNEHSESFLSSVVVDASDQLQMQNPTKDNRFVYRFVRQDAPKLDEKIHDRDSQISAFSPENGLDCRLRRGDHVILSTESSHLAVASGIITEISHFHVSVSFSKRLRLPKSSPSSMSRDIYQAVWRIDKDEFSTSFAIMRFNLVQLFLQSAQTVHLRKMIVDLEAPKFDSGCVLSQDPAVSYLWSVKHLNDDQRRAIIKILTAKDYALILGMPGTGKTSTMVYAVKALLLRGASILLTSYTNTAVDNLLIKLKAEGIDFARIGRSEVVHKEVREHCISALDIHSVEEIKMRLDLVKVVAVTCLGITSPLLSNRKFDVCIMDEAGQTSLPVSLGPLMFASVFVLVGDHYQLPPLVQSPEARENGMGLSLFCRLSEAHPQAISALQSQYRMCASIMNLSNALIYGNRLRCGSSEVENAKLQFSNSVPVPSWLKKVLNTEKPVMFINTDMVPAFEVKDHRTMNNPVEAHIISEILRTLVNHGIEKEDIGIITPYNSQANLLQQAVNMPTVEIHTIDKYQGRDKDCILVSFVRSSQTPRKCSSSLLGDWHRINVALTRAKKKLIMVGSCNTLSRVPLLKLLIQKVDEQSGILAVAKNDIDCKRELKRCSQIR